MWPRTVEDAAEILRRDDDHVGHPEKRMDESAPSREMVVGLAAVVVQDHALAEAARGQDRRNRAEQERPVRRGEDVDHVASREPREARPVERLGQDGSRIRAAPHPAEAARERRVDRDEADLVALFFQMPGERRRLDPVAADDVEARHDHGDPRPDHGTNPPRRQCDALQRNDPVGRSDRAHRHDQRRRQPTKRQSGRSHKGEGGNT